MDRISAKYWINEALVENEDYSEELLEFMAAKIPLNMWGEQRRETEVKYADKSIKAVGPRKPLTSALLKVQMNLPEDAPRIYREKKLVQRSVVRGGRDRPSQENVMASAWDMGFTRPFQQGVSKSLAGKIIGGGL